MGNPLVPLVLWLKWAELKQTQQKYAIFSYFKLIWSFCDLFMTFLWPLGSTPVKPNPNPCHHVYLGWDSSNVFEVGLLAIGPNMTIVELFGLFLPYENGMT